MGLDDTVNLERLATAFEKLADAMTRIAVVAERVYPPEKEKRAAEIIDPNADRRDLYGDRARPEWFDETEQALPGKSRFQQRFDEQHPEGAQPAKPAKRRVAAVPKVQ